MNLLSSIGAPFIPQWSELRAFSVELWLIVTIVAVLLTPFFVRKSNYACAAVALVGLLLALISLLAIGSGTDVTGPHLRGLLVSDAFANYWKGLLLVFVIGIVLLWFS